MIISKISQGSLFNLVHFMVILAVYISENHFNQIQSYLHHKIQSYPYISFFTLNFIYFFLFALIIALYILLFKRNQLMTLLKYKLLSCFLFS